MLAIAAAIVFFVAAFGGTIEDVRLVPLGLGLLALHHVIRIERRPHRQPPT